MKYSLFLSIISSIIYGQDLTGTWTSEKQNDSNFYGELHLVHDSKSGNIKGYTFDIEGDGYCKYTFDGDYIKSEKKLQGINQELIDKTPTHQASMYDLVYKKKGNREYLIGKIFVGKFDLENLSSDEGNIKTYIRTSKNPEIKSISEPIPGYLTQQKENTEQEIISTHDVYKQSKIENYFGFVDDILFLNRFSVKL